MTTQSDEIVERLARLTGIAGSGSLWWRPSLGQAVYDLLAAGKPVTVETLIEQLESGVRPDDLVHRKLSAKAAVNMLRSLADQERKSSE